MWCVLAGSQYVLEVVSASFERICEELEPTMLNLIRGCLYEEIRAALSSGLSLHLSCLLLLISTIQI